MSDQEKSGKKKDSGKKKEKHMSPAHKKFLEGSIKTLKEEKLIRRFVPFGDPIKDLVTEYEGNIDIDSAISILNAAKEERKKALELLASWEKMNASVLNDQMSIEAINKIIGDESKLASLIKRGKFDLSDLLRENPKYVQENISEEVIKLVKSISTLVEKLNDQGEKIRDYEQKLERHNIGSNMKNVGDKYAVKMKEPVLEALQMANPESDATPSTYQIAEYFNSKGITTERGKPFKGPRIYKLLKRQKAMGIIEPEKIPFIS